MTRSNLEIGIYGTECPINLNLDCKFKFVSCLVIYERKFIDLDHEETLEFPFSLRVPKN